MAGYVLSSGYSLSLSSLTTFSYPEDLEDSDLTPVTRLGTFSTAKSRKTPTADTVDCQPVNLSRRIAAL